MTVKINKFKLMDIQHEMKTKNIAVVGDVMLDCYFRGDVTRISPEAPVPVVEVESEFYRFGGAANVAYNIISLGAAPLLFGVIGEDRDGENFISLMNETGIRTDSIIVDSDRTTTAKTRVIADSQHVVRIDKETKEDINKQTEAKLLESFNSHLNEIDAVILQDYNKGVLTQSFIKSVIDSANEAGKTILVDPKFKNFFEYKNVTVFKPNKKETVDAFGLPIESEDEIKKAGKKLLEKLNAKYVLITLGSKGIALLQEGEEICRIETKARKVADVSGAGDTVISTLALALTSGANIREAAYLANYAGGLVCEEVGIVPINGDKLFTALEEE